MAGRYEVVTSNSVSVIITTSSEANYLSSEKNFNKAITVKELKDKLEFFTAASSATMVVKVYNNDKELVCVLDNDAAILGSYPIDNGMTLHIEDSFALRKALEDESNAEKYTMSPEEYNKRDENCAERTPSSMVQTVPSGRSRGRGLIRKSHAERLHDIEIKQLRRPTVPPTANILQDCNDTVSSSAGASNINEEHIGQRMASLSIVNNDNIIESDGSSDLNIGSKSANSFSLNPNATEFVPSFIRKESELVPNKSEIEIVDPNTGQPVSFNDSSDNALYGRDEFSDDFRIINVIQAVSTAALNNDDSGQSGIKYEKEINDVLSCVENLLANSPGLFSSILSALNKIFYRWVGFDSTLEAVANKIVEQSINNNSYAYFGAKLCASLERISSSVDRYPTFRFYVLTNCECLFEEAPQFMINDDYSKVHSIVMFFAELFIQLTVGQGMVQRIESLGIGLLESLTLLLTFPTSENVRFVCKILKLSGWALDEDKPELTKKKINDLIQLKAAKLFDTQTVNILNSVINLASLSWGRNSNCNNSSAVLTQSSSPYDDVSNLNYNTTYSKITGVYGPDGEVLTEEESKFLNDNCRSQFDNEEDSDNDYMNFAYDSEDEAANNHMNEEAYEAYEQFLLTVPQSNRQNFVNNIEK